MNSKQLKAPFPAEDIEWRIQSAGKGSKGIWCKTLAYVTNRAIMNRLDEVCGAGKWCNHFRKEGDGFICTISIKIGDDWIAKEDGSDATNFEPYKGGLSGAMKRAAVQWGIGRYLYKLDVAWGKVGENGINYQPESKNDRRDIPAFRWSPPDLPEWALPQKGEIKLIAEGDKW